MAANLGRAYVQIVPSAQGIKGSISKVMSGEAAEAGKTSGMSIGKSLVATLGSALAAAGIGKAISSALSEGASLQQSIGGIETLFGAGGKTIEQFAEGAGKSVNEVRGQYDALMKAQDLAFQNANDAYKTAGLSANDYMETITSFAASLKSSGLTEYEAAEKGNKAVIDMSDNANKMGTSMDLIQNAYQGFAKQNYTMLDNLKLGYGGTKTEMERLITDAEGLSDSFHAQRDENGDLAMSYADIVDAIHIVQDEMGITGTTADEAAKTFSGSLSSMKAAAKNVLGKLTLGEDIGPSLDALGETVETFVIGNLLPMFGNIIKGLPDVLDGACDMIVDLLNVAANNPDEIIQMGVDLVTGLGGAIADNLPLIAEAAIGLAKSLGKAILEYDWIGEIGPTIEKIGGAITECHDLVNEAITQALTEAKDLAVEKFTEIKDKAEEKFGEVKAKAEEKFTEVKDAIRNKLEEASQSASEKFTAIKDTASQKLTEAKEKVQTNVSNIRQSITEKFSGAADAARSKFSEIKNNVSNSISGAYNSVQTKASQIKGSIQSNFESAAGKAKGAFENLKNGVTQKMQAARDKISGVIDEIKGFFSSLTLKIPEIQLPHLPKIELNWGSKTFFGRTISYPTGFSVYAKAMSNAYMLDGATIFGAMNGNYLLGGERGREMVVSYDELANTIGVGALKQEIRAILALLQEFLPADQTIVMDSGEIVGMVNRRLGEQMW